MIIHSNLTKEQAVQSKPESRCSKDILSSQRLIEVYYFDFEGEECRGQIVVHKDVEEDIKKVFSFIYESKFPVSKVIPISDVRYSRDDDLSCADNNSSGFNYRKKVGNSELSNHSYGRAVDINPTQNPYIKYNKQSKEIFRIPINAKYIKQNAGTLTADSEIVKLFKELGWEWGGDWDVSSGRIDYQHFEKVTV